MSKRWGVTPDADGETVWAVLPVSPLLTAPENADLALDPRR
jgi:hypothetical protein